MAAQRPRAGLVTQAEYARRRGVTKNAVYQAVKSGRIQLVDGRIDPKQADRAWRENTDARRQVRKVGTSAGPAYGTYSATRQERESIDLQARRLDLDERLGKVVSREVYDRAHFDRIRRAQKALMAVPERLGPLLAGVTDAGECTRRLREELELVVEEIAGIPDGQVRAKAAG